MYDTHPGTQAPLKIVRPYMGKSDILRANYNYKRVRRRVVLTFGDWLL